MKKLLSLICAVGILLFSFGGCSTDSADNGGEKLRIVATIFPAYDFARNIAGENAEVSLLLPPGVESHSFEPTPKDMVEIQNCDIFICNGGESESWVNEIIDSLDGDFEVVRMIDSVSALLEEDEEEHEEEHGEEEHDHEGGEVEYDEHVWTSPVNCIEICNSIKDSLCAADSGGCKVYEENLAGYTQKLGCLDLDFKDAVKNAKRTEIVFGDRFPFKYFADEYGLTYYAAFPGCSSQAEPSAATMARLIKKTREDNIPAVFYIEMSNRSVSGALAESTGARELMFHSCHNLTRDEIAQGEDYISLMYKNLENLKTALN